MSRLQALITGLALVAATSLPALAQDVPAPGKSARIDAIKKAGVLRVAVLANAPWLVENTTGSGEHWAGPAWLLSKEYAQRLGGNLEAGVVSHETKNPALSANQSDIAGRPLGETPRPDKVVGFILYLNTCVCVF